MPHSAGLRAPGKQPLLPELRLGTQTYLGTAGNWRFSPIVAASWNFDKSLFPMGRRLRSRKMMLTSGSLLSGRPTVHNLRMGDLGFRLVRASLSFGPARAAAKYH